MAPVAIADDVPAPGVIRTDLIRHPGVIGTGEAGRTTPARPARTNGGGVDPRTIVDALLELSIAGSFSRPGYRIRRALFGWLDPAPGSLAGRTVLITGPTSGLGRAAAEAMAALGARIVLVGRSRERLEAVRDRLVAAVGNDQFPIVVADMASLASVREAAAAVLRDESRLDVFVDNAGSIFPERSESPDGIEATLATMVVGPFAMEAALLPLMRTTAGARVIAVTSGGMYSQRLRLDDLEWRTEPFSGPRAYARAKRAQVALMREWAVRLAGDRISVNAMHPGWADTPGLAETLPAFYGRMQPILRTPAEGADTMVWLACAAISEIGSGHLFLDRRPRPFDRLPGTLLDRDDRRQLWHQIVALAGVEDPAPRR